MKNKSITYQKKIVETEILTVLTRKPTTNPRHTIQLKITTFYISINVFLLVCIYNLCYESFNELMKALSIVDWYFKNILFTNKPTIQLYMNYKNEKK